jgi:hypothetical protein
MSPQTYKEQNFEVHISGHLLAAGFYVLAAA